MGNVDLDGTELWRGRRMNLTMNSLVKSVSLHHSTEQLKR